MSRVCIGKILTWFGIKELALNVVQRGRGGCRMSNGCVQELYKFWKVVKKEVSFGANFTCGE